MAEKFEVTYLVDDGYVSESPQRFKISEHDLEDDMDQDALEAVLDEAVQADFEQKVNPYVKEQMRWEFLEWAKGIIAKRAGGEE